MIIEHESNPSWTVPATPRTPPIDEIEVLLRRYPLLGARETERCKAWLDEAPFAERSALAARPGMAAKLDQIRRDSAKPFRVPATRYVVLGLLIVAMLAPVLTAAV